jgi:peptidoglycan/LPS O-acetylase OafA/YrhL
MMPSYRNRPIPQLTGLRFFAAFSVAIAHGAAISLRIAPESNLVVVKHWLESSASFGMTLFFVLSGFVIHYNYADRVTSYGLRGAVEFFWARFSRLYPLYFFVLFIELLSSNLVTSYISTGTTIDQYQAIPAYVTLSQSWGYKVVGDSSLIYVFGSVVPVTWSISTEWFFYLFYPAILIFVGRLKSLRSCLIVFSAWSVLWATLMVTAFDLSSNWMLWASRAYGPIAATTDGNNHSFARWALYFSPYARIGEFIVGMILAQFLTMLSARPLASFERRFGVVFALLSVLILISLMYLMYDEGGTSWMRQLNNNFGLAVPVALLIFCAVRYDTFLSRICSQKWILFLGEASYSIYLVHFYVYFPFMSRALEVLPSTYLSDVFLLARLATMIALVLLVASATYQLVEIPSRRFLRELRFDAVTKSFGGWAALAPILGAIVLWFAIFGPVPVTASISEGIHVTQATYGRNCGAPDGNATEAVASACNLKKQCSYVVDVSKLGDAAPNCGKDFSVNFTCGKEPTSHKLALPGEAGLRSIASLACEP